MPVLAPPAAPHGGDDNDPRKKGQYIKNIDYASQHRNTLLPTRTRNRQKAMARKRTSLTVHQSGTKNM